ncbi:hypothetical protein BDP27DRAFT_1481825 [Rhodocollybia butyracea]|uniref:Indoleamine 2,3-dioxygenase n=1 Tax=Rhodocollybia butyracea TaxID=206335 RepID=A0A9P5PID6_9AGAR|nr:hypothetical protein BDP27DRAFT_1481825 [Rhodocollybia butyracea]
MPGLIAFFTRIFSRRFRASKKFLILPPQTDFDIDPTTGFLPPEPLPRLSGRYKIWENALAEASGVLKLGDDVSEEALALRSEGESWRAHMRSIRFLDIQPLVDQQRLLQRAHVVLTWLVQYYVHSLPHVLSPGPKEIPESIAVPLVRISRILGISPVITFSDTVTWNWDLLHPEKPVTIDNMTIIHSFSGTDDERHFYQVQAAIELHGSQLLGIITSYNGISITDDSASTIVKIARDLGSMAEIIEEMNDLIRSIRDGCDPYVFYWDMRPWYNGIDAKGPSDPGWIYEGVDPAAPELQYLSGPSGCSSRVHGRMRMYMLGKHREYLQHLEKSTFSLRDFAQRVPTLREPYNDAVTALKKLRSAHMRIATQYIIDMAQTTSPRAASRPVSESNEQEIDVERSVLGTGGTQIAVLLKAGIDATTRAALRNLP